MAQVLWDLNSNGNPIVASFNQVAAGAIATTPFFVAPFACTVTGAYCRYNVAAGATSTVQIYQDTAGTAAGAGTALLTTAFNMNTTTATTITGAFTSTPALAAGDQLTVKVASGSATGSADVVITVTLART